MPRAHTIQVATKAAFTVMVSHVVDLKNRIENRTLIKRILAYSAIKISVKPAAEYSVLKPLTSSLSPSEKS